MPALQVEVAKLARECGDAGGALDTILVEYGIDRDEFPPALVAAAMQGLAFGVVQDQAAGYDTGPDEAAAAMERFLARLEERRSRSPR